MRCDAIDENDIFLNHDKRAATSTSELCTKYDTRGGGLIILSHGKVKATG